MNVRTSGRDRASQTARRPRRIRLADMTWKDYVRAGLGIFFFFLGVAGLVLPILQGVLFLIVSAFLLAPYSLWVQKKLIQLENRFPWIADKARGLAQRFSGKKKSVRK